MSDYAYTFDDIILLPNYNELDGRGDERLDISMTDSTGKLKLKLPVFSSNMDTITEAPMANWIGSKGGMGVMHRFMSIEENVKQIQECTYKTFASVGCSKKELERVEALRGIKHDYYCIDVAHGHSLFVEKMLVRMRQMLGDDVCIMAGNVATLQGADFLANAGADIIKVGIGGGSVCTTRIKTGFGLPMVTSIQDCAQCDRSIVADGGLRTPGDIVKALACGADFVMLGGMLAGSHFTPGRLEGIRNHVVGRGESDHPADQVGTIVEDKSHAYKSYRGMASKEVADDHLGGLTEWKTAEGVATTVPYKNEEQSDFIIHDIVGGLRAGIGLGGATDIAGLRNTEYMIVTNAGRIEAQAHKTL